MVHDTLKLHFFLFWMFYALFNLFTLNAVPLPYSFLFFFCLFSSKNNKRLEKELLIFFIYVFHFSCFVFIGGKRRIVGVVKDDGLTFAVSISLVITC